MPTWSTELPPEKLHHGFELRRTPTSGVLTAIVTSDDLLVCDTHFFHGRTTPCERLLNEEGKTLDARACPACVETIPWRTHVYLAVLDAKKHEHYLYECTAAAAAPLRDYRAANGTMRGCILIAERPKGLKNSKVCIATNTANLARVNLPAAPDVIRALSIIWRLPTAALSAPPQRWQPPTLTVDPGRLNQMREQPDNASDPPSIAEILTANANGSKRCRAQTR